VFLFYVCPTNDATLCIHCEWWSIQGVPEYSNWMKSDVIIWGGGYVYHIILEQEDTGLGGERREINSCIKGSSGAKWDVFLQLAMNEEAHPIFKKNSVYPKVSQSYQTLNTQWTHSEHTVNAQWTHSECIVNTQWTHSEHTLMIHFISTILSKGNMLQPPKQFAPHYPTFSFNDELLYGHPRRREPGE
jgi:hypothetical protein